MLEHNKSLRRPRSAAKLRSATTPNPRWSPQSYRTPQVRRQGATITNAFDILTYMADPNTLRASTQTTGPLSPLLDESQLSPMDKSASREILGWNEEKSREELTELLERADSTIKQHEAGVFQFIELHLVYIHDI